MLSWRTVQFEEKQRFARWVYVLLVVSLVGGMVAAFAMDEPSADWLAAIPIAVVLVLVCLNLMELVTRVSEDGIYVRLGMFFPLAWGRIRTADITASRVVTYRPLRDAGGWGMRFGRFEGQRTRFWNARGSQGVLIETVKRRYIIGSQEPEKLHAAVQRVLTDRNATDRSSRPAGQSAG